MAKRERASSFQQLIILIYTYSRTAAATALQKHWQLLYMLTRLHNWKEDVFIEIVNMFYKNINLKAVTALTQNDNHLCHNQKKDKVPPKM